MEQRLASLALTGFGPFENIKDNHSYKVVKNIARVLVDNKQVRLVCVTEIPVVYEEIRDAVDAIHKELKPDLIVHVGVAKGCEVVRIEQQSFNYNYIYRDMNGKIAAGYCVKKGGRGRLMTSLNTKKLLQDATKQNPLVKCRISLNPGSYACGYCYYLSLYNNTSLLFVHIPEYNDTYSLEQLSNSVLSIVNAAILQIQDA